MADPSDGNPVQSTELIEAVAQGRQILEELKSIRGLADAHLKQAEISRKTADSEALLAFNAKNACETHATVIAGVKGAVEADANGIATNKQRSDEALAALNNAKASVDVDLRSIESHRKDVDQFATSAEQQLTNITKAAQTAATNLTQIEALHDTADEQAKSASAAANLAAQAARDADSAHVKTNESAVASGALVGEISQSRDTVSRTVDETSSLLAQARTAEGDLKKVLEHLSESDSTATGYEARLKALSEQVEALIAKVEGLLPGATSAGLASSFNQQRARFTGPQKQWFWIFVICIIVLVILAFPSFLAAMGVGNSLDPSWNGAWRSFILRLPIMLPVVWLAIYAGRNYMMSLRMEEDYAYKEAISTAFEGYKREMEKIIAGEGDIPTPVTILCTNILRAIGERPGRIYEGRQKDITLATEVQELMEKGAELSRKKLATH